MSSSITGPAAQIAQIVSEAARKCDGETTWILEGHIHNDNGIFRGQAIVIYTTTPPDRSWLSEQIKIHLLETSHAAPAHPAGGGSLDPQWRRAGYSVP